MLTVVFAFLLGYIFAYTAILLGASISVSIVIGTVLGAVVGSVVMKGLPALSRSDTLQTSEERINMTFTASRFEDGRDTGQFPVIIVRHLGTDVYLVRFEDGKESAAFIKEIKVGVSAERDV
jgi:hypothetical protein